MRDIKSLTGLRGFSALWVCLHHYNYGHYNGDNLGPYYNFSKQGSWGVIIFFVLSGFVMAYVYNEWFRNRPTKREYLNFIGLRIARVYPLHLLTLLLWLGFCLIGFIGFNSNDSIYTFVLNLLLLQAWGFTPSISWNQPSWSISVEMFAYLLFPWWIFIAQKVHLRLLGIGLILLLLFIIYPPHVRFLRLLFTMADQKLLVHQFDYGLSMITWFYNFAFGTFIFLFIARQKFNRLQIEGFFILGILLILGMVSIADYLGSGVISAGVSLATGILVSGLYNNSRLGDIILGNRPAVFLGNISYALYLSHIMTPLVVNQVFMRLHLNWRMTNWLMPIQLFVAVFVASLLFHNFEKPSRLWWRSKLLGAN